MVDNSGRACLSDFSLTTIIRDGETSFSAGAQGGTLRWMSPELIDPDKFGFDGYPTKESDFYALGMVIYEVLSREVPFPQHNFLDVMQKILDGERPERPQGAQGAWFTDGIWEMLELCWKHQPSERISAERVLLCLEATPSPQRPDTNVRSDVATTNGSGTFSRFRPSLTLTVNCPCDGTGSSVASRVTMPNSGAPSPPHPNTQTHL